VGKNVLIVEDDAILRRAMRVILNQRGLDVREAASRETAIRTLAATEPDLLVLDLMLPDGSGADVLREARRRACSVPTVVISAARPHPGFLDDLGPLSFLAKPFRIEALLDLVGKAVGGWTVPDRRAMPDVSDQPVATPTARWLAELRSVCLTLAHASEQRLPRMSFSYPIPRDGSANVPLTSLASAVAGEYGLEASTEIHGEYVRVRLNRYPAFNDRPGGEDR